MNLSRTVVAVVGLLVLTVGVAHGQSSDRPWLAVGLGVGSYRFDGGGPARGGLGHVGLRLPITQTFSFGLEANLLWGPNSFTTHTVFGGIAYLYPSSTAGLFLKAGFGVARLDRPTYGSQSAAALLWGLGYDIRVSDKVSLTPFLDGGLQALNTWWQFGRAVSFQ